MNEKIQNGPGRLLRLKEVLKRIPVSHSTWYAGMKTGRFPKPIYLGNRIPVWREEAIERLELSGCWQDKAA